MSGELRSNLLLAGGGLLVVVLAFAVFGLVLNRHDKDAKRTRCQHDIATASSALALHNPASARTQLQKAQPDCTGADGAALQAMYQRLAREEAAASRRAQQKARAEQLAALQEQQRINHMSVADAAKEWRRLMTDTTQELSPAMPRLAGWSQFHMTWRGLQAVPKTSYGMFMKDSSSQRGKRVCVRGTIAQIRSDVPGYSGILGNVWKNQTIAFIALGDTGELVAQSTARFCGIAVGRYTYSTLSGGTNEAIQAVGMFDLAANRHGG